MAYKVDKRLLMLTVLLFLASLFFTFTVYTADMGNGGLAVCFIVVAFILFNLVILLSKKIEIKGHEIAQTTIYGRKSVNISEIEDIGVVKLRWRIILIISDPYKFVFISSFYEDFEKFVDFLRGELCDGKECLLDSVTHKSIIKKRVFLNGVVLLLLGFFVISGFYNILYR